MRIKFSKAYLAFAHDVFMAGVSVILAFYLRLGDGFISSHLEIIQYGVPLFMVIAGTTFWMTNMYKGLWRYASIPDLVAISKAVSISVLIFVLLLFFFTRLEGIPRSILIIQVFTLFILLGGPRFVYRLWRDQRLEKRKKAGDVPSIAVLLVGADDGAELFIRATLGVSTNDYDVVGILDQEQKRGGRSLLGVPIYNYDPNDESGEFYSLLKRIEKKNRRPQKLVFTASDTDSDTELVQKLYALAEKEGLTLARLPGPTEFKQALSTGETPLRSFAIEDLLGRAQASLDMDAIQSLIAGKKVLITGAGGTIGGELTRQICSFEPSNVLVLDQGEFNLYSIDMAVKEQYPALSSCSVLCDVRDRDRVFRIFEEFKPDLVFHAAALKHVPMVELNPEEGILTNLIGTMNVADAARANKVQAMVQISTDKAVNPTNVMGASKRLGEFYSQALDIDGEKGKETRFMTVRFGNVLGSSGSVVPLFKRQLEQGGPLTVTHPDIKRYFMTVREAASLVLQASAKGVTRDAKRGQIFVLDMGKPVKIVDVAKKIITLAGLKPEKDIKIVFTGLRPGEKLYEELFDQSETALQTDIEGVLAARPQPIDLAVLKKSFLSIEQAARHGSVDDIHRLLGRLVQGYESGRSAEQDEAIKTTKIEDADA